MCSGAVFCGFDTGDVSGRRGRDLQKGRRGERRRRRRRRSRRRRRKVYSKLTQ